MELSIAASRTCAGDGCSGNADGCGSAAHAHTFQQRQCLVPRWLMYLHLLLAVSGFILLGIDVFA